jgi:dihydrofolate reductase
MKTVLVFVSTLDGKVTKGGDPFVRAWSSREDQDYFNHIWKDARLIVMGSNTYNADPFKASRNHLIVVMTRQPAKYSRDQAPGQIEFTDESPARIVERFEKEGHEQMLIVGGPNIATSFLKAQLIDELWLTIEPKIFGLGENIVTTENLDIHLNLISCKKVNSQGTLITSYSVIKNIHK